MKITYITSDPLRYPRVKKLAYSANKYAKLDFEIMIPKFRLRAQGGIMRRIFLALINYPLILLQTFFIKSDVFWVTNCPDVLILPFILRRKLYILEYRSPWSLSVEREFGRGVLFSLSQLLERIVVRYAWIITLTTRNLLERVIDAGKPVYIIPNYPLENFRSTIPREEFRMRNGVKNDEKIVLFIGRLVMLEGVDMLPALIEKVVKAYNKVVFWIIGDGPLYPLLSDLKEEMVGKIKLFGWQPYESIPDFINASDVCILPRPLSNSSKYYNEEGVQKISEYMAFRKPIIACGVAKSKEYFLVDEREMARGIIEALRGAISSSSPRFWEEHSEKKLFELFHNLFKT